MEDKLCLGYLGLIKPEIDLISTILRTSSRLNGEWTLVDDGECDALIAYNTEKDLTPFVLKNGANLIIIKRRGETHPGYVFLKPFRADELVDVLILIKTNRSVSAPVRGEPSTPQKLYGLKKWPPNNLLSQNKHFMLLAVYLSRGTKTIENLVTLSGQSEKFCQQFIHMLEQHSLLTEDIKQLQPERKTTPQHIESKKTFLSLLKSRFGIGKL